jgi:hypothetical protein
MAQKLETQPLDTKKVVRVETAPDHLTVIEVGDPVTMVAVGNQGAFNVERRENKVFVKPVEEGAKTNLFVWTVAGRFAYELVPATSIEQMHFAIDQAPTPVAARTSLPAEKEFVANEPAIPAAMLTRAKPILLAGDRDTQGRVEIALRDVYRDGDRLYMRYAVINRSLQTYQPTRPAVWRLTGVRSPQSLIPLSEHQLGERLIRSLKTANSKRLEVVNAGDAGPVDAGGHSLGWLVVEEPEEPGGDVSVLRLEFAADRKGTVEAVLVLRAKDQHREVANARPAAN